MLTNLFQKYYLLTFLALSGLLGLALGNLTSTIFEQQAGSAITTAETQLKPAQNKIRKISLSNFQPIITHNIFSPALRNQAPATLANEPQSKSVSSSWSLIGTVSGGDLPLATLKNSQGTAIFQLNEELPDGAVLSVIERNRVKLRYPDGSIQVIEIADVQQNEIAPRNNSSTELNNAGSQIEELDDNRWVIPSSVAESARGNIGELLKQAQAVPYLENGETTGFQLRRIQRGSLIAQIGLQRGDILRNINGLPLNSPEKALQLFGQLRQAKKINIDLERRGKAMTFAYEIR